MFGSVELRVKFGIFELGLSICKGDFLNLFSKFSLEVVPARLTLGFRVKFRVGRVSWYQSFRFLFPASLSLSYLPK